MSFVKNIELFVLFFKQKIEKSENKLPYFEIGSWKSLESDILYEIKNNLLENDKNIFHNNILNSIDINKNDLNPFVIDSIKQAQIISESGKEIIINFMNIINTNIDIINIKNTSILKFYFRKLFIPILEKWRVSNFKDIYYDIDKFNEITNILNIKYIPDMNMINYYSKIIFIDDINLILKMISFFENLKKIYSKSNELKSNELKSGKDKCNKCLKEYTIKTINKYNGMCGKCYKLSGKIETLTKLKIPKKIREESWKMHIGDTIQGICYSCNDPIKFSNFQTGHILSKYEASLLSIDNLRPICSHCNLSCGIMNINDFKKMIIVNN